MPLNKIRMTWYPQEILVADKQKSKNKKINQAGLDEMYIIN